RAPRGIVGALASVAPPSRRRRPRSPAADEAMAIPPAWIRKPRRDQSGATVATGAPAGVVPAPPARRRSDMTWTPPIPATNATINAVVGVASGDRRLARKPAIAKAPNPAAARANERRTARIPRPAPTSAATITISVSRASLSVVPERATALYFAPGRWRL